MFTRSSLTPQLNKEIASALSELEKHETTSEEYGVVVERVSKLHKLKSEERLKLPSLDTVLIVGANIFGILWLTRYEKSGEFVNSKALSFVMKPR